jgi:hypothetical protein
MVSQEDIAHQQTLLKTYRRNLAHLERQAASHGGESDAPVHIVNSLEETRANISRIESTLRGWGVKLEDAVNQDTATTSATQGSSAPAYPSAPVSFQRLKDSGDKSFKYDAFISYSHSDEEWVEHTLLKTLEDAGVRACIDFRDFAVGRPAILNMQDAAMQSRHTLLVITSAWIKSEWTLFESLLTRTKDPSGLMQRTIPLRLQAVDLPDFISMLTWVDFTRADRLAIAWKQLFTALDAPEAANNVPSANAEVPQAAPITVTPPAVSAPSSFRDTKKRTLERRLGDLIAEYEALTSQIDNTVNAADRLRLQRQAGQIEQEIGKVEEELRAL